MSMRWAFMEPFEVPDLDDPTRLYLWRLRIMQTPWFGVYLHRFDGPDSRPTLHDHPWNFLSIILRGSYTEQRYDPATMQTRRVHVRRVNAKRAEALHYIEKLHREHVWSLVLVGRRRRVWGYAEFAEPEGHLWTRFDAHPFNAEFERAVAARRAS